MCGICREKLIGRSGQSSVGPVRAVTIRACIGYVLMGMKTRKQEAKKKLDDKRNLFFMQVGWWMCAKMCTMCLG